MLTESSELTEAKARNLGHLLLRCARVYNEIGVARLRARVGLPGLRASHMQLLPHIDLQGTRQTELARRLGVSKQAAGELVADLEAMGAVERVPDPQDGRARLVRFTEAGRAGLLVGLGLLAEIEGDVRAELGAEAVDALVEGLAALLPVVEAVPRD